MAGMLPGVGVHARRRNCYDNRREEASTFVNYCEPSLKRQTELLSSMDETALRALHRLEQKLYSSSRSKKLDSAEIRSRDHTTIMKNTRLDSRILLARPWQFKLNRTESQRQVCAVCLEDFKADELVMDLSCSHKYHSHCLLPWLKSHSRCPCCRSPVNIPTQNFLRSKE